MNLLLLSLDLWKPSRTGSKSPKMELRGLRWSCSFVSCSCPVLSQQSTITDDHFYEPSSFLPYLLFSRFLRPRDEGDERVSRCETARESNIREKLKNVKNHFLYSQTRLMVSVFYFYFFDYFLFFAKPARTIRPEAMKPLDRGGSLVAGLGVLLRVFVWYIFLDNQFHQRSYLGSRLDLSTSRTRFEELADSSASGFGSSASDALVFALKAAEWRLESFHVVVWIAVDLWTAFALSRVGLRIRERYPQTKSAEHYWYRETGEKEADAAFVARTMGIYLMNPLGILTCAARSLAPIYFCLHVTSWFLVTSPSTPAIIKFATILVGSAVDADVFGATWLILLWPMMKMSFGETITKRKLDFIGVLIVLFGVGFTVYAGLVLEREADFDEDLRPNPGLWWYLATQTFSRFRPYFAFILSAQMWIYAGPIHFQFSSSRPEFAFALTLALLMLLQPFPELFHVQAVLSLLSVFPSVFFPQPWFVPAVLVLFVTLCMQPVMMHSWLIKGTGNANYYYFQTVVMNAALASLVVTASFGVLGQIKFEDVSIEREAKTKTAATKKQAE